MGKDFLFCDSPGPIPSNFSRSRDCDLEMTFPTPVLPCEKALLLTHCYYTTLQHTSENFSLRPAHLENGTTVTTFKLLPVTARGKEGIKEGLKQNKTAFRSPVWGIHELAKKALIPEISKACCILASWPSPVSDRELHKATTMTAFHRSN